MDLLGDNACVCKAPTVNGVEVDLFRSRDVDVKDEVTEGLCLYSVDENGLSMYILSKIVKNTGECALVAANHVTIETDLYTVFVDPSMIMVNDISKVISSATGADYTSRAEERFNLTDTVLKHVSSELSVMRFIPAGKSHVFVRCLSATANIILPWDRAPFHYRGRNVAIRLCSTEKIMWPIEKLRDNSVDIYLCWNEICNIVRDCLVVEPGDQLSFKINDKCGLEMDDAVSKDMLKAIENRKHGYCSDRTLVEINSNSLWATLQLNEHCISVGIDDRAVFTHNLLKLHLLGVLEAVGTIVKPA